MTEAAVGKTIAVIGLVIVLFGLLVMMFERFGARGGMLPGDIHVRRGGWTFYFPIMTSIVLSIILTLILWAMAHFGRR